MAAAALIISLVCFLIVLRHSSSIHRVDEFSARGQRRVLEIVGNALEKGNENGTVGVYEYTGKLILYKLRKHKDLDKKFQVLLNHLKLEITKPVVAKPVVVEGYIVNKKKLSRRESKQKKRSGNNGS